MDSLKEIWSSLGERFKNPLLYSFVVSWIITNYKIVVVLSSNAVYSEKFDYIDSIYPPGVPTWYRMFFIPALCAILYVFVLPGISLLSTWAASHYEGWHSTIRSTIMRKARLTLEERDVLERRVSELNSDLRVKAQAADRAKSEITKNISHYVVEIFNLILPATFLKLKQDAAEWQGECVKPDNNRTINGTPEQEEFVVQYGIPKQWAKIFNQVNERTTVWEVAKKLEVDEKIALDILICLSALSMLKPVWNDDELYFNLLESRWVAMLNSRVFS